MDNWTAQHPSEQMVHDQRFRINTGRNRNGQTPSTFELMIALGRRRLWVSGEGDSAAGTECCENPSPIPSSSNKVAAALEVNSARQHLTMPHWLWPGTSVLGIITTGGTLLFLNAGGCNIHPCSELWRCRWLGTPVLVGFGWWYCTEYMLVRDWDCIWLPHQTGLLVCSRRGNTSRPQVCFNLVLNLSDEQRLRRRPGSCRHAWMFRITLK